MAHGTRVNSTAYGIAGGKCLVGGTEYSIKKGRTLIGGTGYDIQFGPPLAPSFSDNSWETIIWACQNNAVPSSWVPGNSKSMTIKGKGYKIDIIGKNHDTYTGGGTVPLTFQMHDCYDTEYRMKSAPNSNVGGYGASDMHNKHLPEILSKMPSDVQDGIRSVDKPTSAGGQSPDIVTVPCKLFLLSEIEVFGRISYSRNGEGAQYAYYADGNSKIKNLSGSPNQWYERSPNGYNSEDYCIVNTNGSPNDSHSSYSRGVAFAFCF